MAFSALLKFSQPPTTGADGQAFVAAAGTVEIRNSNTDLIQSWKLECLYGPPGSIYETPPGTPIPLASNPSDDTPFASIAISVPGCYRIRLTIYTGPNYTGTADVDIRNVGLSTARRELILPPYQKFPDPLPLLGSGIPGEKPGELNFDGQGFGWAGDDSTSRQLLHQALKAVDGVILNPSAGDVGKLAYANALEDLSYTSGITTDGTYLDFTGGDVVIGEIRFANGMYLTSERNDATDVYLLGLEYDGTLTKDVLEIGDSAIPIVRINSTEDIIFQRGGVEVARWTEGSNCLQFADGVPSVVKQADHTVYGEETTFFSISAQAGAGGDVGGFLYLYGGFGGNGVGTSSSDVNAGQGGGAHLYGGDGGNGSSWFDGDETTYYGNGGNGASVLIRSGVGGSGAGGSASDGIDGNILFQLGNTEVARWTAPRGLLQWEPSSSPLITQAQSISGAGTSFTIRSQQGQGGSNNGGDLILDTGAGTGAGVAGGFLLSKGTSRVLKWSSSGSYFEMGLGTVASTGSLRLPNNFTVYAADGSGGNAGIFYESGTGLYLGGGTTSVMGYDVTAAGQYSYNIGAVQTFIIDQFGFHFGAGVGDVTLDQWDNLVGAGYNLTIAAQDARGSTATAGGNIIVRSGIKGNTGGKDGSYIIQLGNDQVARFYEGSSYTDKHFELSTGNVDFVSGVAPTFTQPDTTGAANNYTIRAQNSTASTGAQLLLYGGNSVSSAAGDIQLWGGVAATGGLGGGLSFNCGAGAGSSGGGSVIMSAGASGLTGGEGGQVSFSTGPGIGTGSGSGAMLLTTGDANTSGYARSIYFTTGYAPSGAAFRGNHYFRYATDGSGGIAYLLTVKGDAPGTLEFGKTVTPIINHEVGSDNTAGKTFTIQAQAGNGAGNNNGGNLDFKSGAKVNSGVVGAVRLYADSALKFAIDGTGVGFFSVASAPVAQQSAPTLTDATGGSGTSVVQQSGSYVQADINNALFALYTAVNSIKTSLTNYGLLV